MEPTQTQPSTPSGSQGTQTSNPADNNPFAAAPPPEPSPARSAPPQAAPAAVPPTPAAGSTVQPSQAAPEVQPSQTAPVAQPSGAPSTPSGVSPDVQAIIDEMRASRAAQAQPQGQQQQTPQITPEEFNKKYGIPTVTADTYEAIFGVAPDRPERVQALNQVLQGLIRPSVLMAQDLMETRVAEIMGHINPLTQAYQSEMDRRQNEAFYQQFPEFKGYEGLINEIKDAHVARKKTFASAQDAFKSVADTARQILKQTQPQGSVPGQAPAGGQAQQPVVTQTPTRRMTPSAQGGRGGTPSATNNKSTAEQIFGSQ